MERKALSDFMILAGIVVVLLCGSVMFSVFQDLQFSGSIKKFESCQALSDAFSDRNDYYNSAWRGIGTLDSDSSAPGAVPMAGGEESQAAKTSGDYSETNVQVEGVDEADIVKTDGEYIYTLSTDHGGWLYKYYYSPESRLVIVKADPAIDMNVVSETVLANFTPQEMFVEGDMLIVFGYTTHQMPYPEGVVRDLPLTDPGVPEEAQSDRDEENRENGTDGDSGEVNGSGDDSSEDVGEMEAEMMIYPPYYYMSMMTVKMFDISDRANPVEVRTLDFEGNYLSSRMIGDTVYFIVNSYPRYSVMDSPEEIVPLYRDSNEGEEFEQACGCGDVMHFEPMVPEQFVTVVAMSITDPQAEVSRDVIVGSGQNIYMSENSLYIAEVDYPVFAFRTEVSTVDAGGEAVDVDVKAETPSSEPGDMEENGSGEDEVERPEPQDEARPPEEIPKEDSEVTTNVHKFAINGMDISYTGYMSVPGIVLNQFSMDEYDNHFRIATTRQPGWWWGTEDMTNNVYVFDANLQRTGALEDLAPGETIYSARFMGEKGYLVTFKRIDPFFVIDLSDHSNPRVLGKLKIPGYSDYLHPYDENHIIGIGKETVEGESPWGRDSEEIAWQQGIKIAMFDVTDVENPVEMHRAVIGDRGTESEALHDHKAFLFDREKNLLVIPVLLAELTEEQKTGEKWQYGDYVYQGAYVYDISLEGIDFRGRITHIEDQEAFIKSGYYFFDNRTIKRSLYIGNFLYTVSDSMIKANLLEDLSEESRVGF